MSNHERTEATQVDESGSSEPSTWPEFYSGTHGSTCIHCNRWVPGETYHIRTFGQCAEVSALQVSDRIEASTAREDFRNGVMRASFIQPGDDARHVYVVDAWHAFDIALGSALDGLAFSEKKHHVLAASQPAEREEAGE